MIRVPSERPVIVCDLDGCIVANPDVQGTINDWNYWHDHWTRPESAELHDAVVDMVHAMRETGHFIIILTARPEYFAPWTLEVLERADLFPEFVCEKSMFTASVLDDAILVMRPDSDGVSSSAQWKRDKIATWLNDGVDIRLAIEDHPPNAEAIRSLVPVFLYENKRESRYDETPTVASKSARKRAVR